MRYKKLGDSDLNVSEVGLGTWAMGGDFWGDADDVISIKTIQTAVDNGVNLIDTAPAYGLGHAEKIVGEAIKGRRQEVILATKCGLVWEEGDFNPHNNLKPDSLMKEIDDSLRRLQVDYVDLYQIHWPDPATPLEDSAVALNRILASGKVRYMGISNFSVEQMKTIKKYLPVVSTQTQFSLLYHEQDDVIDYAYQHQMGVLSYGSLSGGILSGKYKERPAFSEQKTERRTMFYKAFREDTWDKCALFVDELRKIAALHGKPVGHVAINWANQQDKISTALVGARTPDQAIENAASSSWMLAKDEIQTINQAYDRIICGH
jgi:aryl-alcohol dehydrogenase-like predicted oxidoreductase